MLDLWFVTRADLINVNSSCSPRRLPCLGYAVCWEYTAHDGGAHVQGLGHGVTQMNVPSSPVPHAHLIYRVNFGLWLQREAA